MVRLSGRSRGCKTCRQKRIKCDETLPKCMQCLRRGRECPGPLTDLFVFESGFENPTESRRLEPTSSASEQVEDRELRLIAAGAPGKDEVLGLGTLDPFSSMAVEFTQNSSEYFQHFMLHTARCCWPFRAEMLGVWSWQEAMIQPAVFHGLVSMSATHRFHLQRENHTNPLEANQSMVHALESHTKMIETAQEILDNLDPQRAHSLIVIIAFLVCVEAVNSNISGMDVHMAGLQRLIQLAGGIDVLDLATVSFLMGIDLLWAIVKCTRPALTMPPKYLEFALSHPVLRILSYPSPEDVLSESDRGVFRTLGSRFTTSVWCHFLDPSLRFMIQNFCTLIMHYEADEQRTQREKIVTFGDNDPWNLSQRYLLSLSYDNLGPRDIKEPLRRSILAYSMTRYCKFGAFPCMDTIAATLKDSLVPRLEFFQSAASDLLFWILYVGALTARKSSSYYLWYCNGLAEISATLGLDTWAETRGFLEQFFYIHRPSDGTAEELWGVILSLRCTRGILSPP